MESSHNADHSSVSPVKSEVGSNTHRQPNWENRTMFTVIMLVLCFPIGALLALFWTNWRKSVKFLICLPLLIVPILIFIAVVIAAINPAKQTRLANIVSFQEKFVKACMAQDKSISEAQCLESAKSYNTYLDDPGNSIDLETLINAKGDDFGKAVTDLRDKLVKESETNSTK